MISQRAALVLAITADLAFVAVMLTFHALYTRPVVRVLIEDQLSLPGEEITIPVRVEGESKFPRARARDIRLEFLRGERVIGEARTDEQGGAVLSYSPETPGLKRIDVRIVEPERYLAPWRGGSFRLGVFDPKQRFIVCDLDGTIMPGGWGEVLRGREAAAEEGARTTLQGAAQKYRIVYITERSLRDIQPIAAWLDHQGFPGGPILPAPEDKVATVSRIGGIWRIEWAIVAQDSLAVGLREQRIHVGALRSSVSGDELLHPVETWRDLRPLIW